MSDALYHDAILALAKNRDLAGRLENPTATQTRDNPLCGDRVTFDVEMVGGKVERIRHHVRGCALCQASAAALAAALTGHGTDEFAAAEAALTRVLAGARIDENAPETGVWRAFAPVGRHASRLDCVRLPFAAARPFFEA